MSKPEETENPEIEARWKEFWEDHKDYDPSWVGEFLGELGEALGMYLASLLTAKDWTSFTRDAELIEIKN